MRGYEVPAVLVPFPLVARLRASLAVRWAPPVGAPVEGPEVPR